MFVFTFGFVFTAPPILCRRLRGARELVAAGAALRCAPAGFFGRRRAYLPRRVSRAAQKSLNAKAGPTEMRGRGNQPRPAATVSGDRMQLPGAARCRFPSRWQPHAFCRGAPHKSGSREILSSLKDPSAMRAVGGSPEDEMKDEQGRRTPRPWLRGCSDGARPREHANVVLWRSTHLYKVLVPAPSPLCVRRSSSGASWENCNTSVHSYRKCRGSVPLSLI